ncbi:hypothetical protein ACIPSJ_26975 [Streptomyces sp. NPDC090088]
MASFPERPEADMIRAWLDSLEDAQAVQHVLHLRTVSAAGHVN